MSGIYNVSLSEEELGAYADGLSESIPKDAPESDFAAPPRGLYVGDAHHAALAVQAVTGGLMGNKAKKRGAPGVKSKIASAISKFYSGAEKQYYLSWLHTGKKPERKPASEIGIATPHFMLQDEDRFPDVPITPGVNLASLTLGDPNPLFVTRPLAIEGGVSDNNLQYTAEMLDEIYQQVIDKRPPARLGHVSESNRSWEVPPDSGLWVGAVNSPDDKIFGKRTVYGKCYIYPTMPLHEMIEKRKAAGTSLSNSIWGLADLVDNADGTVSSAQTDIESIDFVSPERAALKALGGEFVVTSEMDKESLAMAATEHDDSAADLELFKKAVASIKPETIHEALHEAGKAHEVASHHIGLHEKGGNCIGSMHEMFSREGRAKVAEAHLREEATPEETYGMLSEAHRAHVAECYAKEMGKTMTPVQEETKTKEAMSEMSGRLSETEKVNAELKTRISELEQINKKHEREDFERELDKKVDTFFVAEMRTEKGKEVVANLKKTMRKGALAEMAGMENGQVAANIPTACDKVWAEDLKALTEMAYAGVAGPNAVISTTPPKNAGSRLGIDPATGHFDKDFMKTARDAALGASRTSSSVRKGGK